MIPIRDHNPTSRPAVLVPILIGINAVVFFFVQPTLDDADEQTIFFVCNAAIPYEVMHGEHVLDGVREGGLTAQDARLFAIVQQARCPEKNVWASIVQSMFFHGGFLHIAGNMLFLWVFGNNIEDRLGRLRFLLLYFIAGLVATYAQSVLNASSVIPMIGASGAVAGVLGAYLLLYPHARVTTLVIFFFITWIELPAVVVLGLWFLLQVFQQAGSVAGEASGVAYMAHIGGFVAGMLLLLALLPRRARPQRARF